MPPIRKHLIALETAGLIRLVQTQPELEYLFRHVLVQDAAYDSLLKADRQRLHRIVGEVLEKLYGGRLEALAPRLGEHFYEAGDHQKACQYFTMAGDTAAKMYANQEAIGNFTRALQVSGDDLAARVRLLQARGGIYEVMGNFEQARIDQELSLEESRQALNTESEWQALINLGLLWASRNYEITGTYIREALVLARKSQDQLRLAHSLNRMGNYYTNMEETQLSLEHHQQALEIFRAVGDEAGIAETYDLLGMASALGCNLIAAKSYLEEAIRNFRQQKNSRGLSSSLATLALSTTEYESEMMVVPGIIAKEGIQFAEEALSEARLIGWRSGEAYSNAVLGLCLISTGEYQRAMECIQEADKISGQIGHIQWEILTHMTSGTFFLDILSFDKARAHLQAGLDLARKNHSSNWIHINGGFLAITLIEMGDLAGTQVLLDSLSSKEPPAQSFGQRLILFARIELALAQENPVHALEIIDRLLSTSSNMDDKKVIIRLWMLKGQALSRLSGKAEEAEKVFREALQEAETLDFRSRLWRLHKLLAQLYSEMGRNESSQEHMQKARMLVLELADNIPGTELKEVYLNRALSLQTLVLRED